MPLVVTRLLWAMPPGIHTPNPAGTIHRPSGTVQVMPPRQATTSWPLRCRCTGTSVSLCRASSCRARAGWPSASGSKRWAR
ncbi:Uncharacterised protein [Acinetobacter baumannii]|nr:Uncharacterised protein [Acinetobacter baumannii]